MSVIRDVTTIVADEAVFCSIWFSGEKKIPKNTERERERERGGEEEEEEEEGLKTNFNYF